MVANALVERGRLPEAYRLAWTSGAATAMLPVSLAAFRGSDRPLATAALQAGLILLVNQANWPVLAAFARSRELVPTPEWKETNVKNWVASESEGLQILLVKALARSAELGDAPANQQRQLSEFLRTYLRVKGGTWREHIGLTEAGAAFERGGRFTDAISFYEAIGKEKTSKEEKRFARERWLICKQRQLEHERAQRNANKIDTVARELAEAMQAINLKTLPDLPAFPVLPNLTRPEPERAREEARPMPPVLDEVTLPEQVPMHIGAFRVVLSRKNERCNIEHTETMETAFLMLKDRTCGGGGVEFEHDGDGCWRCESWKLSVTFPKSPAQPVSLNWQDIGIELRFSP